jgi:hypothetical protein
MPEPRKCPLKGTNACRATSAYPCGHCPHCGWPLDNHDGLGLNGKPVDCKRK